MKTLNKRLEEIRREKELKQDKLGKLKIQVQRDVLARVDNRNIKDRLFELKGLREQIEDLKEIESEVIKLKELEKLQREKEETEKRVEEQTQELAKTKVEIEEYLEGMAEGERILVQKFGIWNHPKIIPLLNKKANLEAIIQEGLEKIRNFGREICFYQENKI